jgi:hypothetical protein
VKGAGRSFALEDALARVTRALEAIRDCEFELAEFLLDDLAAELWKTIETREAAS